MLIIHNGALGAYECQLDELREAAIDMERQVRPITEKEPKPRLLSKVGLSELAKRAKVKSNRGNLHRILDERLRTNRQ